MPIPRLLLSLAFALASPFAGAQPYKWEFRQKGGRGVPLIVAGSRTLNGYSAGSLDALLKGAGY